MVLQFTLSALVLYFIPSLRPRPPPKSPHAPIVTPYFYFTRLVPCGLSTSLDIGLGNSSLIFISLTFYTMIKSSSLVFVLLFAFLFRLESPSLILIAIITTMTAGVVMMVAGETSFHLIGFILILSAACFSGLRWSLTQILLLRHPGTPNPFATLFFITPIMFFGLVLMSLIAEGPYAVARGVSALVSARGWNATILMLTFPGILAFCMTAAEFALLQRTSVVTLSICGIFKEVMTVLAAGVVFHDRLTPINVSGLCITIASIACYNYWKVGKMRREARERGQEAKMEGGLMESGAEALYDAVSARSSAEESSFSNEGGSRRRSSSNLEEIGKGGTSSRTPEGADRR